jgi:hypothetical protein
MKTIFLMLAFLVVLSFGQQLRVDSVAVDSVWNSDSSWSDAAGATQSRQSRDLIVSFSPVGPGSVSASFSISIDSAKTWNVTPNPLIVLDSGEIKPFACNRACHAKLRVLGSDRAHTAFKVTIRNYHTPPEVLDTIAPVITLNPPNPDTILVGTTYVESGGSVIDNKDGPIPFSSVSITEINGKPVTISTALPGVSYVLVYNVKDKAGNAANAVTRMVAVVGLTVPDTIKPVIQLLSHSADTVLIGTTYTDPGAIAIDNIDGNITSKISAILTNAAGAAVPLTTFTNICGPYKITYTVSDAAGNGAVPVIRNIFVQDTTGFGTSLFKKYGVPLSTALPKIVPTTYKTIIVDGNGPTISLIRSLQINWDLANKGLYIFSLTYSMSPFYINFGSMTQTFDKASPQFTILGTTIPGLDGSYYIKADATTCIWVRTDGSFAIIFSN